MRIALLAAAAILSVAYSLPASAQAPGAAEDALPATVACSFESGTTVTYVKGAYKQAAVVPLSFRITGIDLPRQSASLHAGANSTAVPLRIVRAVNANHFLEVVTEGFLNTTTIYDRDPAKGSYPAVHSRHFGLFGEPVVAQYYGFCKAVS